MENASKALLIAGGVLITVLVLSLAAYLFTDFSTTAAKISKQNDYRQLTSFNTQFTIYSGRKDISGYELVSIINLAKENNSKYELVNNYVENYKIDITVNGISVINYTLEELEEKYIINKYQITYKCDNIHTNAIGRVNEMIFSEN